ncbi:outer membrane beta-barrel protein [Methylobacterium sp. SD274]|uniref:outer membrane beta-barrel protein n=1 Tax=Methylobacterium sp. SD274 TaxID=2782009 RepID=UPI001A95B4D9|nr:outer membrane beta-barrel protein [Methylobacterium sp. SD274]MBO1021324.1 outer membrane beta-barrel protein [Methylobacterium sp. SD274]
MRAGPTAGWRRTGLRSLILTAAVALPGVQAQAQSRPATQLATPTFGSTNPSSATGAGTTGGPTLRGSGASGDASTGAASPSDGAFSQTDDGSAGTAARRRSPSPVPPVASSAGNNRNPTDLLRMRAIPPRRFGVATTRPVRSIVRTPSPDLRLTPVIRSAVVGAPLPTPSPAPPLAPSLTLLPLAGISTPGAFLGSALRRPLVVDEAYAPLGIKLGTFTFLPVFQQSVGYDTNPDQITPNRAKGSLALRTEGELAFRSDWSSHELAGELRGGYLDFPDNQAASRPNGAGTVRLRLDANRSTTVDVETRFLVDTQRPGSPDINATLSNRPIVASYGTTIGVTETFNRLQVSLRGLIDRSEFESATLSNGAILNQSDRNLNQYGLRLRASYEISPVISPFLDVLADTRVYDLRTDSNGIRRNSDGITVTGGARVALTRFVNGEVSAGLQHRTYVDPGLKDLTAPIINAALIWTASPLTTVRLNAATGIIETAVPGSSGVLTKAVTLEVQHDLLRNLSITLGGGYLASDYDRVNITERGFSATARLDYRFNRWLSLRGSYIYQQIDSSSAGSSFSANTWLLGLRVTP